MKRCLRCALFLILLTACAPSPSPTPLVVVVVVTATPAETAPQPGQAATQPPAQLSPAATAPADESVILSGRAGDYAGQQVTVRIERAWCSYQQQIKGKPTFCNDQPYPQHDFTLLIWGEDWSDYDGLCLLVKGMVTRYRGKAQIVAESRNQISLCR